MRRSLWDARLLVMPTPMRSAWDGADSGTGSWQCGRACVMWGIEVSTIILITRGGGSDPG